MKEIKGLFSKKKEYAGLFPFRNNAGHNLAREYTLQEGQSLEGPRLHQNERNHIG